VHPVMAIVFPSRDGSFGSKSWNHFVVTSVGLELDVPMVVGYPSSNLE
jgi:hypothetical protein